jgi:glycosyltransferase involved in cell wall biosynthesis
MPDMVSVPEPHREWQAPVPLRPRWRLWIDLTTIRNHRSGNAVGLTRVERNLAAAYAEQLGADGEAAGAVLAPPTGVDPAWSGGAIRRAGRAIDRRFRNFRRGPLRRALGLPPKPAKSRPAAYREGMLRRAGRAFETWWRGFRRGPLRRALVRLFPKLAPPQPAVRPGDSVLFLGELWTHHDDAMLRRWAHDGRLQLSVLLYDLTPALFPHWYADRVLTERFIAYLDFLRTEAAVVIAISESTRRDFIAWCAKRGPVRPRVVTVRLGDDLPAPPPAARPNKFVTLAPGRFVLSVSTVQVRKNYDLLYALWRRFLEQGVERLPTLVIAGRRGWLAGDLMTLIKADPLTRDHILVADDPDDAELAWLYGHCRFTLYPSLYEGWGLPIAESLAHGKFCLASATSSMPEVSRGLALHLDPLDFTAWYRELESLFADDARLAALEARIRAEFRLRTWSEAATDLLALLGSPAAPETAATPAALARRAAGE